MNTKRSNTIRTGNNTLRKIKSEIKISSLNSFINILMMSNFKPSFDDSQVLVQYLFKSHPEEMSKLLNPRILSKIPEAINKFARLVSFSYSEKNSIVVNSKLRSADDILLITGDMEILNLSKQIKSMTKSMFLDYLINLKTLKEDELVKRCLRLNAIGLDTIDTRVSNTSVTNFKTESSTNCLIKSTSVNEYIQNFQKPLRCDESISNTTAENNESSEFIIYVYQKYQSISGVKKLELVQTLPEDKDLRVTRKESAVKICSRKLSQQNKLKLKILKQDLLKYSVICTTPCILMMINSFELAMLIKELEDLVFKQDVFDFLKKCHVFNRVDDMLFKDIVTKYFKEKVFKNGEMIYKEGDEVDFVYFIRKGSVSITVKRSVLSLKNHIMEMTNEEYYGEIFDENSELFKRVNQVKIHNVLIMSENTILGLDNITDTNGKVFVNAAVNSGTVEVFKLQKLYAELRCSVSNLEEKTKELMLNRMRDIVEAHFTAKPTKSSQTSISVQILKTLKPTLQHSDISFGECSGGHEIRKSILSVFDSNLKSSQKLNIHSPRYTTKKPISIVKRNINKDLLLPTLGTLETDGSNPTYRAALTDRNEKSLIQAMGSDSMDPELSIKKGATIFKTQQSAKGSMASSIYLLDRKLKAEQLRVKDFKTYKFVKPSGGYKFSTLSK